MGAMTDSSDQDNGTSLLTDNLSADAESLKRLRRLLLGPYQDQLERLQDRLDTPELHADDVSKILPEAIFLRSSRDQKIELALEPITAKAIRASIKKDRKILVDALFPVMGPAIRKAIASTLQAMIQSFNQILEHSLSLKGLKWRFEALRTRRPFAEVVLLHTLVYQVEQVFLIHKDTGLVLQHVVGRSVAAQDPDLVSGMMSAIKDFVQDSFGGSQEDNLETLRIGERNVWLEQGDHAILAAVIRGNPPMDVQMILRDALDAIHYKQRDALQTFDGDVAPFEEIRYILDDCLQAQFEEQKRKKSFLLWFVLAILLGLLGFWVYQIYAGQRQWNRYMDRLHSEPGVVVTGYEKKFGRHFISGLRDPLAPDPAKLLQEAGLRAENITFKWEAYYSTHSEYANRRIRGILKPPDSVSLNFNDGIVTAKGSALAPWLPEAQKLVALLPWVKEFQFSEMVDIEAQLDLPETVSLALNGRTLVANGAASHAWIQRARKSVLDLPGISGYQDQNLVNTDLTAVLDIKDRLEKRNIFFEAGLSKPSAGQENIILETVADIHRLDSAAKILNQRFYIELFGHADSSGTDEKNIDLSLDRAESLRQIFVSKGVPVDMTVRGLGSKSPLKEALNSTDRSYNRRVNLKVHLYD
jgi:OOP family OmpA-OmpF porin